MKMFSYYFRTVSYCIMLPKLKIYCLLKTSVEFTTTMGNARDAKSHPCQEPLHNLFSRPLLFGRNFLILLKIQNTGLLSATAKIASHQMSALELCSDC